MQADKPDTMGETSTHEHPINMKTMVVGVPLYNIEP